MLNELENCLGLRAQDFKLPCLLPFSSGVIADHFLHDQPKPAGELPGR